MFLGKTKDGIRLLSESDCEKPLGLEDTLPDGTLVMGDLASKHPPHNPSPLVHSSPLVLMIDLFPLILLSLRLLTDSALGGRLYTLLVLPGRLIPMLPVGRDYVLPLKRLQMNHVRPLPWLVGVCVPPLWTLLASPLC